MLIVASAVSLARAVLIALRDDCLGTWAVALAARSLARNHLAVLPALLAVLVAAVVAGVRAAPEGAR